MNRALGATNIVDTVSSRPFFKTVESWCSRIYDLREESRKTIRNSGAHPVRLISSPINAMSDKQYRPDIVVYIMWLWHGHVSWTGSNRLRHCWLSWMSVIVLPKLDVDFIGFRNITKMLLFYFGKQCFNKTDCYTFSGKFWCDATLFDINFC